jgi:serine/threonine protein kinase
VLSPNIVLQNRYRVVRQLGQGGMGTVYEAVDQRLSSVVAIKETRVTTDEARSAFEREASLMANLRHPSLPNVIDHFSEDDGQYLVMEFIPGEDLGQLLELRGRPFPSAEVLSWADELLKAIEHLHGHNPPILHRDIKPSNLKLTREGELFLLDFGLAKGAAGQMPTLLTSRSVRGYTPVYSPLEQIHGGGTDPRSDLYSVGATLYHLLTGVLPVDAPTRFNALDELQADPLLPADQLNPDVSHPIAQILGQALAMNRRNRPASAAAMRRMLREAASLPAETSAGPPGRLRPALLPTEPPPGTDPLPPTRHTAPDEPSAQAEKSPSEPTIKEVPKLIQRPAVLPAPRVPHATSQARAQTERRGMKRTALVLFVSLAALLVLVFGTTLVVPLFTRRTANPNQVVANSTPTPSQQASQPSPSPTPSPSPEFVKVRLRLISEGASGCSLYTGEKVTLTVKDRTFSAVTNRNGFASFTNVPCGDVAKITAPGIKLQFKSETLSITHNLQCSGSELYLGSYGDIKGALVSEKFANACFKPY